MHLFQPVTECKPYRCPTQQGSCLVHKAQRTPLLRLKKELFSINYVALQLGLPEGAAF